MTDTKRCQSPTKSGDRCRAKAIGGSPHCFFHAPSAAAERAAACKRGGQNRSMVIIADTPDVSFDDATSARRLLAETAGQLRRGQIDPQRASVIGYLVTIALKAIEMSDLERRLAAVETMQLLEDSAAKDSEGQFEKNRRRS
jgi:hypothetical protein